MVLNDTGAPLKICKDKKCDITNVVYGIWCERCVTNVSISTWEKQRGHWEKGFKNI